MGSEGPKSVMINATGFKKFKGVDENPSEIVVNKLRDYVESNELPAGVNLGVCTVLETAGEGAVSELYKALDSGITINTSINQKVVWVHLGVNSGALKFGIERQAVNEASFCCPDELGWQPQQLPIILDDGGISHSRKVPTNFDSFMFKPRQLKIRKPCMCYKMFEFCDGSKTSCPIEAILEVLKSKEGDDATVVVSDDAGRFVCNFVYYHSLRFAEEKGHKSLFVHLPPFSRIDQQTQMKFILALLHAIASTS